MNASHYFICLSDKGIENWFKPDDAQVVKDIEQVAKIFDLGDTEHSVYEVVSDEEAAAAAAHGLADSKPKVDARSVLRIRSADLEQFGIRVESEQLGTTGLIWLDHRHRNLRADRGQIIDLIRYLVVERVRARGEDRVRRLLKFLVANAMRRLLLLPDCQCPQHVKLLGRWALGETDRPPLDLDCIQRELYEIQFPDDVIRPAAEAIRGGDQLVDWYRAVSQLRHAYANHYLPVMKKRYGL